MLLLTWNSGYISFASEAQGEEAQVARNSADWKRATFARKAIADAAGNDEEARKARKKVPVRILEAVKRIRTAYMAARDITPVAGTEVDSTSLPPPSASTSESLQAPTPSSNSLPLLTPSSSSQPPPTSSSNAPQPPTSSPNAPQPPTSSSKAPQSKSSKSSKSYK